jgi:hypothetical protein
MADDFDESHDGQLIDVREQLDTRRRHTVTTESEQLRARPAFAQRKG